MGDAASAQLMIVLGTNHENYEDNLSLGLKLHAQLEETYPGIMRPLQLRAQRFNQDLCPGALLIEVGTAGNTHAQALRAAEYLAEGILALAKGANY
jgi:stage II sporulation protein P